MAHINTTHGFMGVPALASPRGTRPSTRPSSARDWPLVFDNAFVILLLLALQFFIPISLPSPAQAVRQLANARTANIL